jgi:hypothetical protein
MKPFWFSVSSASECLVWFEGSEEIISFERDVAFPTKFSIETPTISFLRRLFPQDRFMRAESLEELFKQEGTINEHLLQKLLEELV